MKKKIGKNGKVSKQRFTHPRLLSALYRVLDTMERCHMPFVLLDETADQVVRNQPLDLSEISVGVQRKHYTTYSRNTLRSLERDLVDAKVSLSFEHEGVPIVVWIIDGHYKFLQYPDLVFYGVETFYVPNPFGSYWNARHLIK